MRLLLACASARAQGDKLMFFHGVYVCIWAYERLRGDVTGTALCAAVGCTINTVVDCRWRMVEIKFHHDRVENKTDNNAVQLVALLTYRFQVFKLLQRKIPSFERESGGNSANQLHTTIPTSKKEQEERHARSKGKQLKKARRKTNRNKQPGCEIRSRQQHVLSARRMQAYGILIY